MGYDTRSHGIQTFYPDETDDEFYIEDGATLLEISKKFIKKWPNAFIYDITLSAEYIHTDCLGYDRYDPGDYTKFIRVSRKVSSVE